MVESNKKTILENANRILNDEKFADMMKTAVNPNGQGDAVKKPLIQLKNTIMKVFKTLLLLKR